jgi:hypothetical protein
VIIDVDLTRFHVEARGGDRWLDGSGESIQTHVEWAT